MKTTVLLALALFSLLNRSFGQNPIQNEKLIQFSGVIVNGDLEPLPFCNVMDKAFQRGTTSDYYGYFSFVAYKGDTIQFSSVGYKTSYFAIPDSLKDNKYSLIHTMTRDTIMLDEAIIYPWPSKEQFAYAFVHADIPNDDYRRALKNLAQSELKELVENSPMNGAENFNYQMQQNRNKIYYAGQLPPNNLLNPLAWAKFIRSWKNGDFKRK